MLQAANRRATPVWTQVWLAHVHGKVTEWAAASCGGGSRLPSNVELSAHSTNREALPPIPSILLAPAAFSATPLRSLSGASATLQHDHHKQQHEIQHNGAHSGPHIPSVPSQHSSSKVENAPGVSSKLGAQDTLHPQVQHLQSAGQPQTLEQRRLQLLAVIRGCDKLSDIATLLRDRSILPLERDHFLAITLALRMQQKQSRRGENSWNGGQALRDILSALAWHVKHSPPSRISVDVAQHILGFAITIPGCKPQVDAVVEATLNSLAKDSFTRVHSHCATNPRGFHHLSQLARTLCKLNSSGSSSSSFSYGSSRPVVYLFREVVRAAAAAASLHGHHMSQVWLLETLLLAPPPWMEFAERRSLAAKLLPVAMSQLPGYDTFSLALLMRCAANLNLFNYDAWKRKNLTADTKERLSQQGVEPDVGKHFTSQSGQVHGLELLHLLAAFHTRRAELSAMELSTMLWSLGSAVKVDSAIANMLAFQDDGHAAILTQAVATQAAAMHKVSQAAQALRKSGAELGESARGSGPGHHQVGQGGREVSTLNAVDSEAETKLNFQEGIDVLKSVCPPGTWQWPPPLPPSPAPSEAPAYNFLTIMDDLMMELAHHIRSAPASSGVELCHSLSLSLWSLSHLRFYSKPLLDAIYEKCTPDLLAGCTYQTLSQFGFSICQLDGGAEQCKHVLRLCAQELARQEISGARDAEGPQREHSLLNLFWAFALADDPGPPEFRDIVLNSLQHNFSIRHWTDASVGGSVQTHASMHQLYSYLLVMQELEWEEAMRQQLQHKGLLVGKFAAEASAPHLEALYLPSAPFHPPFGQAQAAGSTHRQQAAFNSGSTDLGTGQQHSWAVTPSPPPTSPSSALSIPSRTSKYMPWDEPWLQRLLKQLASTTDLHYTRGSGFERAVRSALVQLCSIEGYPWRLLRGGFSPDGHVSIDICLESVCGSVRVSVEADGPYHFMVNDTSRSNGSSMRRQRALRRRGILEVSVAAAAWEQWTSNQQAEKLQYLDRQLRTAVRREVDLLGGQQPHGWAPGTLERLCSAPLPSNEELLQHRLVCFDPPNTEYVTRQRAKMAAIIRSIAPLLRIIPPSVDIPAAHIFLPLHMQNAAGSPANSDSRPRTWGMEDLRNALIELAEDLELLVAKQQRLDKQQQQLQRQQQAGAHKGTLRRASSSSSSSRSSDNEDDAGADVQGSGDAASRSPAAAADGPSSAALEQELFYRFKGLSKVMANVEERVNRKWKYEYGTKDPKVPAGAKVEMLRKLAALNDAARRLQAIEHRLHRFFTDRETLERIRAGKK